MLDGGAYASSTPAVVGNAGTMGIGPYIVPNVHVDAYGVYTNNPPCGAMRGFGSVQAAFAYEAQMDKLAAALGLDPVRAALPQRHGAGLRGADRPDRGQPRAGGRAARAACCRARPAAAARRGWRRPDLRELPGGVANTTHGEGVSARRRLRGRHTRTSASPRASTTTRPPGCGWSWSAASRR